MNQSFSLSLGGPISMARDYTQMDVDHFQKQHNLHLMTGPEGNSEFCSPRILMFPRTKSRETLRPRPHEDDCKCKR